MDIFIAVIFYGIIFYFVGKWLIKTYITEPQKDKRIGEYKFAEFKEALKEYKVASEPLKGSENCLIFREHISNGVENIGYIDYSINDFIQNTANSKIHNYYFTVEAKIRETKLIEKSNGYIKTLNMEVCKSQIDTLRNKVVNNYEYQRTMRLNQLR